MPDSELLRLARELAGDAGTRSAEARGELARAYVEVVTFAPAEEIVAMLAAVRDEDWMGLPVWARNLAFRLAVLQRPGDVALLRDAAGDLLSFGPDGDDHARSMRDRAARG
ncbi:hypothetical protein ACTI_60340 [Actinoplanes sp. OR16]|uniref:hypothetical protein n=1 Tax=Actinoplanes sp. OR16 TaxID=946334 RepID=UPI000F6DC7B9|nr:hypothetical protein [Actinoplanes sp. OR16]BBH69349.1 hypothetical protein ACTI_60340 [Actinoplanes sp. OR16]